MNINSLSRSHGIPALKSTSGYKLPLLLHGLFFLFAAVLAITIPWVYVTTEQYFYFWDLANFHDMAVAKSLAIRESFIEAFLDVGRSVRRNYNEIFTLPLAPIILLFGDSRLVYIVSLAIVYLLPLAMVMGALAVQLVPSQKAAVFWSGVAIALFMPPVWASLLLGWPDSGAALLIALAAWVYLQNTEFDRWHQFICVGVLIAIAMLFRRHFAYSATALLLSIGVHSLSGVISRWRVSRGTFFADVMDLIKKLSLTGGVSLVTLAVLAPRFLLKLVTRDYNVHDSYVRFVSENLWFYGSQFGLALWVFAAVGLIGGILTAVVVPSVGGFVILFGTVSLLQWVLNVGQLGTQYNLHFAFFIVLGITSCFWMAWGRLKGFGRITTLAALFLFLGLNFSMALYPLDGLNKHVLGAVFSARYPPKVRTDYDEIRRLIIYLRQLVSDDEAIYVGASSYSLNWDILRHAERVFFGPEKARLNIPYTPEVDSRDSYASALKSLQRARYVLVAEPFQHHLRREEQQVVERVVAAFKGNWDISRDFELLSEKFVLANGAIVSVYRRIRSTSPETARDTLRAMESVALRQSK